MRAVWDYMTNILILLSDDWRCYNLGQVRPAGLTLLCLALGLGPAIMKMKSENAEFQYNVSTL